jgi:hypothetical protein
MDTAEQSRREAELLRELLAVADRACPACGYSLRGLTGSACPECGQELRLAVGLAEPATAPLLAAGIGLSACGIIAAFSVLGTIGISLWEGEWPPQRALRFMLLVPLLMMAVDAGVVLRFLSVRGRSRFIARPPGARWVFAMGCWAFSVAVVVGWIAWAINAS